MNKNLMIGLGVLAVAGIAYYMYKKPKATSNVSTKSGETSSNARGAESEEVSNPLVSGRIKNWSGYIKGGVRMCFDYELGRMVACPNQYLTQQS